MQVIPKTERDPMRALQYRGGEVHTSKIGKEAADGSFIKAWTTDPAGYTTAVRMNGDTIHGKTKEILK